MILHWNWLNNKITEIKTPLPKEDKEGCKPNKNIECWEDDFTEKWNNETIDGLLDIKDFIRNLLQAQRSNLVKEIEVLKKGIKEPVLDKYQTEKYSYNQAISEVIHLINSSK